MNIAPDSLTWVTGSGNEVLFDEISKQINDMSINNGMVFIGTDSSIVGEKCIFATAICLHKEGSGGKYFFVRSKHPTKSFSTLFQRMVTEVEKSVLTAVAVSEKNPSAEIEIHLDIGKSKKSKTRFFIDTLTGYAKSAGFNCKIKPYAWASASVADKHSK